MRNNSSIWSSIVLCIVAVANLTGCAPQARYFNVDVRESGYIELPIENRTVAVFSISSQSKTDSTRLGNVAVGLAEKIEEDRGLSSGEVAVYSIPKVEFDSFPAIDTAYIGNLMLNSGAHVLVFVDNLRFSQYGVQKNAVSSNSDNVNIIVPYSVDLNVYDAMTDSLLLSKTDRDSIYMQVISSVIEQDRVGGVIAGYLPQISQKIGMKLGGYLSQQWITSERMLISYDGDTAWENPYMLAQEFKWNEAIQAWMVLAESNNPKKAAFAAYNIAVGCEMMEQFDMALKWIDFSLKKFRFREAVELKLHITNMQAL